MADPRSDRRKAARFAVGFATVATVLWATGVALEHLDSTEADAVSTATFYTNLALNYGGAFLSFLIQMFVGALLSVLFDMSGPVALPGIDILFWPWVLATIFAGAFVQGLVYALIGLLGMRLWRRRRTALEPELGAE